MTAKTFGSTTVRQYGGPAATIVTRGTINESRRPFKASTRIVCFRSLNPMSQSRLRGRSAGDLALKAVQGASDKLGDNFGLMVHLVEVRLLDVCLIESNIQMALDLFARAHGDIKEASLFLKGIPSVCLLPC